MYKIESKSGQIIGYTNDIRYIKTSPNGSFIETSPDRALGIAYKSTPYHLSGKPDLKGAVDDVRLIQIDEGELIDIINDLTKQIIELQEIVIEKEVSSLAKK